MHADRHAEENPTRVSLSGGVGGGAGGGLGDNVITSATDLYSQKCPPLHKVAAAVCNCGLRQCTVIKRITQNILTIHLNCTWSIMYVFTLQIIILRAAMVPLQ